MDEMFDAAGTSDVFTSPVACGPTSHASNKYVPSIIQSEFASTSMEETMYSVLVCAQNTSPLPIVDSTPTSRSYETRSLQSSAELYMPDWFNMWQLTSPANYHEPYNGICSRPGFDRTVGPRIGGYAREGERRESPGPVIFGHQSVAGIRSIEHCTTHADGGRIHWPNYAMYDSMRKATIPIIT